MITAERRGFITGSQEASQRLDQTTNLTELDIRGLATLTHHLMSKAGYAHIEPQVDFVNGFVNGFVCARSVNN